MRLKEIHKELVELKDFFLDQKDWQYARRAYEILNNFEDDYKNKYSKYAGYCENLIRIRNSILMIDRVKVETQFVLGMTSMTDIISRELRFE